MREIEFRGKTKSGEWVYGALQKTKPHVFNKILDNYVGITTQTFIVGGMIWHQGVYLVKKETVGQYTGLKDKNGKKIYEGDIVLVSQIAPAKVFYNEENACYAFDYGKNGRPFVIDLTTDTSLEVIGNIYDNPELLEDKDD